MAFRDLKILQLADSTLPTGGFVFSSGLESMARLGWLKNADDMYAYLDVQLTQACSAEIPFINTLSRLPFEEGLLATVMGSYDAFMQVEELRSASIRQARSWLDILVEIEPSTCELSAQLRKFDCVLHYVPVFAVSLRWVGLEEGEVRELYLYMILRDQISAAVRLGLTGPSKGAAILSEFLERAGSKVSNYAELGYESAYRAAPMLEIAQGKHNELYTKLFQN